MSDELSLGGPKGSNELIDYGMSQYQKAKQKLRKAEQKGNDKAAKRARKAMVYWEVYIVAAGAISLELCAIPPTTPYSEEYLEKRANAQFLLAVMNEKLGFEPGPMDEDELADL